MGKFLPLAVFVILAWFLYDGLGRDTKTLPSPLIGKSLPNIEVKDFNTSEKYLTHSILNNKITLFNVWASWCVTCKAEHRVLMQIAKSNQVNIVGINYKDSKKLGQEFIDLRGNPYNNIIFDEQGKLGLELGVYAVPETFLVDSKGLIQFKLIGELTTKIWKEEIFPLIQQLKISAKTNTQ